MAVLSLAPVQFISSIPPATRAFTAATIVFTALYYFLLFTGNASSTAPYLLLVPGSSLFYPWVFLTSAFIETSIIEVCEDILSLRLCSYGGLVHLHFTRHPRIPALPGATVGRCRNCQIHRSNHNGLQYHRLRSQLARIHGIRLSRTPVRPIVILCNKSLTFFQA